jgi:hypothetical protein
MEFLKASQKTVQVWQAAIPNAAPELLLERSHE